MYNIYMLYDSRPVVYIQSGQKVYTLKAISNSQKKYLRVFSDSLKDHYNKCTKLQFIQALTAKCSD